jgi:hypothetical protein
MRRASLLVIPPWLMSALVWLTVICLFVGGSGCSGCLKNKTTAKKKTQEEEDAEALEKKKKKKEKPKPDFETLKLQLVPGDETTEKTNQVKLGHWIATRQLMRANNFDFNAELLSAAVDGQNVPLDIEHTDFRFSSSRPAQLPKGQVKQFEAMCYVPRRDIKENQSYLVSNQLRPARGGREVMMATEPIKSLTDYTYHLVVLSSNPASYAYLNLLDSVEAPIDDRDESSSGMTMYHYRIVKPKVIANKVGLPENALTWTSIAYLLWDDQDPAVFSQEQQTALIDWLHWGGQVIISGPNSLDKLKGSFLDPYLPADGGSTLKLATNAFSELNRHWSKKPVKEIKQKQAEAVFELVVPEDRPMLGIELSKRDEAQFLPGTGELAVERRVGGGRIVATAFPLNDRRTINWRNLDNFFNACLLRRPPRKFDSKDELQILELNWADRELTTYQRDPRLISTLRYFTRDIGYGGGEAPPTFVEEYDATNPLGIMSTRRAVRPVVFHQQPQKEDWHFGGYVSAPQSGVAGWNDFSGASSAARDALERVGVEIPSADFVFKALVIYLLVLAPLNWLVFRLMGRVEWAWIAAPIIAIVGAIVVIRAAQLDIGFVRSRTEIAVLEAQGGFDRAHVTRYTALYTSLSSSYTLTFDDSTALALPFAVNNTYKRPRDQSANHCQLVRDKVARLSGLQVYSNKAGLVHSEQMLSLGGPISLVGEEATGYKLQNGSQFPIREAGVLRRTRAGQLQAAFLPALEAGTSVALVFEDIDEPLLEQWDNSSVMSSTAGQERGHVNLSRLAALATQRLQVLKGDVRLVGWMDNELPGLVIRPSAAQQTSHTLVLVHLRRGELPAPVPDENLRADKSAEDRMKLEEAMEADMSEETPDKSELSPEKTES